jgi:hypothetical protein
MKTRVIVLRIGRRVVLGWLAGSALTPLMTAPARAASVTTSQSTPPLASAPEFQPSETNLFASPAPNGVGPHWRVCRNLDSSSLHGTDDVIDAPGLVPDSGQGSLDHTGILFHAAPDLMGTDDSSWYLFDPIEPSSWTSSQTGRAPNGGIGGTRREGPSNRKDDASKPGGDRIIARQQVRASTVPKAGPFIMTIVTSMIVAFSRLRKTLSHRGYSSGNRVSRRQHQEARQWIAFLLHTQSQP